MGLGIGAVYQLPLLILQSGSFGRSGRSWNRRDGLTWSMRSRASKVIIVVPVDTNISVWPEVDCSGEMIVHE